MSKRRRPDLGSACLRYWGGERHGAGEGSPATLDVQTSNNLADSSDLS
jgi:hypothetical protein